VQDWSPHQYACFFPVGTDKAQQALASNIERGKTATGLAVKRGHRHRIGQSAIDELPRRSRRGLTLSKDWLGDGPH